MLPYRDRIFDHQENGTAMNSRLIHWGKSALNHRWLVPILLLVLFMALLAPRFVGGRTLVPMDVLNGIDPWSNYFPARADNPFLGDAATQHYEWVVDFHRRVRSGDMPAWQPLIAGGVPYSPNGSIAVHYPPTWIYALFPPDVGFALFMVLHFWLASLGVWLLLRAMGAGNLGAVFGGVAYAMSGLVRNWSFGPLNLPSLALAPLLLYGVERCVSRPSVKSALVLSMTTALMLVGGNPQFTFQMMIGAFVFGVVRMVTGRREWRPLFAALGTSACGVLLGFVLAAAEVAPFLVISENVLRAGESLADIKITVAPLSGLTRLAMPNFFQNPIAGTGWSNNPEVWMDSPYVGLLAAALAAAALFRWRDRRIWALGGVALVGLVFAYIPFSHELPYRLVPIWDRFRGALRWLSVANLGLALLAGIGLDLLGRALPKRRLQGWLTAAALIGLAALPFVYIVVRRLAIPSDHLSAELTSLGIVLVVSTLGVFLATTRGPGWALLALVPELIFHFLPFFPINPRDQLKSYEKIPEMRVLARFDDGRVARLQEVVTPLPPLIPNVPMLIGRADIGGFTVLMPSRYIEFLNLIQNHGDFAKHTNEVPSFIPGETLDSPLINLANVRYLISEPQVSPPAGWKGVPAGTLVLYENPVAHPEAWIASRRVVRSRNEVKDLLARRAVDPYRVGLVTDPGGAESIDGAGQDVVGTVELIDDGADRRRFRANLSGPGELVWSQGYHEGWQARVDGRPVRPEAVDIALLGVPLVAGSHEVELWFDWSAVRNGRAISLAALILWLTGLGLARYRVRAVTLAGRLSAPS